jgi:hypothetical protein
MSPVAVLLVPVTVRWLLLHHLLPSSSPFVLVLNAPIV